MGDEAKGSTNGIRRGKGLQLSLRATDATEAPGEARPEGEAPRKGRGLRLSVTTDGPGEAAEARAAVEQPVILRRRVALGLGELSYLEAGEGPPLLLLHGYTASARFWEPALPLLGRRFHCYAPDLPGFGDSPAPVAAPTVPRLAEVALAFADALGMARFDLAGHSLGSAIAALLALKAPARVRRMVLSSFGVRRFGLDRPGLALAKASLDTSSPLWQPWHELLRPWTDTLTTPLALPLAPALRALSPSLPETLRNGLADTLRADPRAMPLAVGARSDPELHAALRALSTPTLLLLGGEDPLVPRWQAIEAQVLIPEARLALIERCGHFPTVDQPERYAEEMTRFFAHHEGAEATERY